MCFAPIMLMIFSTQIVTVGIVADIAMMKAYSPGVIRSMSSQIWKMEVVIESAINIASAMNPKLWYLSMDLVPFLFDLQLTWELRRDFSLWFGLGMLILRESDSELAKFLYCLTNLGLLLIGTALRRRVFAVFGGLGVAGYLGYLANRVFADSLLFPVVLSFIGLAVIGLGVLWQRHEQRLGERLRAALPVRLRRVVEAGD